MTALIIIFAILYIILSIAEFKAQDKHIYRRINQILFIAGVIAVIVAIASVLILIETADAEISWKEMAKSVYFSYFIFSMVCLTLFIALLVSSLFLKHKSGKLSGFFRVVRYFFSPAASIFLLILSVYGYFIDDEILKFSIIIGITAIGESMIVRIVNFLISKYDSQRL